MRLFVFSNHGYGFGEDVRDAAAAWAATREIPCVVVLSGRGIRPERPPGGGLASWARRANDRFRFARWRRDAARRIGRPPVILDDVNAASFASGIEAADAGLVCGFNQIFGPEAIARFGQLVNVHPSVLPLYRGPVPSRWCLVNGEAQSGFTLHRVVARIDAGEVLHQEAVSLAGCTTPEEADRRISRAAAAHLAALLDRVVLDRGDFAMTRLDAKAIYRVHRDYAGFVA